MLGLKPPEGALAGLDGVLIGSRTRDLLQRLLEARCRLSQTVLLIEDLHWIDSVSQEVLGKIVDGETKRRLLVLPYAAAGIRTGLAWQARRIDASAGAAAGGRYQTSDPDAAGS